MTFIFCGVFLASFYCFYVCRWARSQLEQRLVTKHRDFMNSIKVRVGENLDYGGLLDQNQLEKFTIVIDGVMRDYESLFEDTKTLKRLNDLDVLRLSQKYKKNKRYSSVAMGILMILGFIMFYM